jgi:hypothetical protein
MNSRMWIVGLLVIPLAAPLRAREKSDVIILDNSDRLTGEIKSLKSGVLYVSLDYIDGTIAVQWSKVAGLKSKQLFIVRTQDGNLLTGTLSGSTAPEAGPMMIEVAKDAQHKVALEHSSIISLGETSRRFQERFSGEVEATVVQSKGNDSVQYSIGSQVEYRRERWAIQTDVNSNLSSSSGSTTSSRNQVSLTGYHFLSSGNWFYAGVGNMLQSSTQKIAILGNVGPGLGVFLRNTDRTRFSLLGGLVLQSTDYSVATFPAGTRRIAAGLVAADLSVFKFKKTNLNIRASLFPAVSNPDRGRVYFDTNASYYQKIIGNLSWTLSFYGNWDTRPPSHLSGSDYGSSSGLSWTFGAR